MQPIFNDGPCAAHGETQQLRLYTDATLQRANSQLSTGRTTAATYLGSAQEFTFAIPLIGSGLGTRAGSRGGLEEEASGMMRSLAAADVNFLPLQSSVFCVECEMLSENNTSRCLACGSKAVLSLSRILGGSLRGQQTAHLIADAELDRLVRSLLGTVAPVALTASQFEVPASGSARHHLRVRNAGPQPVDAASQSHAEIVLPGKEIDFEPGISIIAEKAQALTGATGAAIALRRGSEIICRARAGRTAPDIGVRLQTDKGLSAECVRTGEVLLCHDAEMNPRVDLASCRRLGVRSILVAPLRHLRRTLGIFEVLSARPNAFDQQDVATMQFLSGMMVATLSRLSNLKG